MKEGNFLKFIPPLLSGGDIGNKSRYMLVVEYDKNDNVVKMINVSSLKNKEHNLLYSSNIEINNHIPLPVPSFAKVNTIQKMNLKNLIHKGLSVNGILIFYDISII